MHVIRFYNVKIPLVKNTSILYMYIVSSNYFIK